MAAAGSLNFTRDEVLAQDIYNRQNEPNLSFENRAKDVICGLVDNLNGDNASLLIYFRHLGFTFWNRVLAPDIII